MADKPHVVIVGGGFEAPPCAVPGRPARRCDADRQPQSPPVSAVLYQGWRWRASPAEIAAPIRSASCTASVTPACCSPEVESVDPAGREVKLVGAERDSLRYDYLVPLLAPRITTSAMTRGRYAVGLGDLDDAIEIRRRVLVASGCRVHPRPAGTEAAPHLRRRRGPTGVELAERWASWRGSFSRRLRRTNPASARAAHRGRPAHTRQLPERASERATRDSARPRRRGAQRSSRQPHRRDRGVLGAQHIPSATVLWALAYGPRT